MPDVCDGIIAHVSPFQRGLFDILAWSHINCMAASHSNNEEVCIIHVGKDNAFNGSLWIIVDRNGSDDDDDNDDDEAKRVLIIPLSVQ